MKRKAKKHSAIYDYFDDKVDDDNRLQCHHCEMKIVSESTNLVKHLLRRHKDMYEEYRDKTRNILRCRREKQLESELSEDGNLFSN